MRGNTGADASSQFLHRGTGSFSINAQEAAPLIFNTTNTERMRIDSAGFVGIGVAAPTVRLDVSGSTTVGAQNNVAAAFGSGTSGRLLVGSITANTPFINAEGATNLLLNTNGVERMRISSVGRVGIGGTSTASKFYVLSDALGGTAGDEVIASQTYNNTGNGDYVSTKYRRVSTGASWTSAQSKIQRTVDVTEMGYIAFGGASNIDVRIGTGVTDIITFLNNGTTLTTSTTTAKVLTVKGVASQTGNLQDWQDSAGTTLAYVTSAGAANFASINNLLLTTSSTSTVQLKVKQVVSQTSNLVEFLDSSNTVMSKIDYAGSFWSSYSIIGNFSGYPSGTTLAVNAVSASTVGAIIRGAASQTANLQEWQNSAGTALAKIDASGNLTANTVSTPVAAVTTPITASTHTVGTADTFVVYNTSATCTVTLPAPASFTGRVLYLKTITAFAINSASSNVKPIGSNTAGTAILAATAGKFATLVSDGTNWVIMASN